MAKKVRRLIRDSQVKKAVKILTKYVEIPQSKKLLDDDRVDLQFIFKKMPHEKKKTYKITLPHPFITDTSDICLFVKDLDIERNADYEVTKEHFKQLLLTKGVKEISEVIPLRQMKKEYKPYEARRNLVNMYTLFLADERIMRFLPVTLGKEFYMKKKLPVAVNLRAVDLCKEIGKALSRTYLRVSGAGSCSMFQVGLLSQPKNNLVKNIISATQFLAENLPGGLENIRSIGIKTPGSILIPLYISDGSVNDAKLPKAPKYVKEKPIVGELSTLLEGHVKVYANGYVKVCKKKIK